MAIEGGDASGWRKYFALTVKVVFGLVLLPFLPIAVAFNIHGIADSLSVTPGITKGGGVLAGAISFVYVSGILGLVIAGSAVSIGGGLPPAGGTEETPEPRLGATPSATPTAMPTATVEPIAMATPPKADRLHRDFRVFKQAYWSRLSETFERDDLREVPVLATEYLEDDEGRIELWVVWRECDKAYQERSQRINVANSFAITAGNHDGAMPDRLRSFGVTDLVNFQDTITYIEKSEAEAVYNGTMEGGTYLESWWERQRQPTPAENETAYRMAVNESGRAAADDAFYDDHYEVGGWCANEEQTPPLAP